MKTVSTLSPTPVGDHQVRQARATRQSKRKAFKNVMAFWIFVGPLVLGALLFVYIPILWSILLSFFNARSTVTPTEFIGFDNYRNMLGDAAFRQSLLTITIFAFLIIPTTTILALGLALLVKNARFAQPFFRSVFFLPTACSYVVASMIWKISIFSGQPSGLVNSVLIFFHLDPINTWITSPNPPLYWIVLVTLRLWIQLGGYMILFIAGLQGIPQELYEAAYVDGAKKGWITFRSITLPLLRNTTIAVVILNLIAAFQAFDEFYNVMGSFTGSSGNVSLGRPPLLYLYQVALGGQDYGRGSAGAIILALIIIIFTILQSRFFKLGSRSDQ